MIARLEILNGQQKYSNRDRIGLSRATIKATGAANRGLEEDVVKLAPAEPGHRKTRSGDSGSGGGRFLPRIREQRRRSLN